MYHCAKCRQKFTLFENFEHHECTKDPCTCLLCGQVCWIPSRLTTHLRTHLNIRLYECSKCDKSFTQKQGLEAHKSVHDDISFTCKICKKS